MLLFNENPAYILQIACGCSENEFKYHQPVRHGIFMRLALLLLSYSIAYK